MKDPRCFISYSWDSQPHREWVRKLAARLRESGVDAILDQFHFAPGMDLTKFMEKSVRESDFVLLVCTPTFAQKADAGVGGVGYEKTIVTGEMLTGICHETKFVPLLREGDAKESLPSYLKSRLFVDFRDDSVFESRLDGLLRHFYAEPMYPEPPVGLRPQFIRTPPSVVLTKKSALQKKVTNRIGMEFALIQEGSFLMGSHVSPEEIALRHGVDTDFYKSEYPVHTVKISESFYLQTTEMTVGQWRKFINETGYKTEAEEYGGAWIWGGFVTFERDKKSYWNNPGFFQDDDHPITCVTWDDAQELIKWLNRIDINHKHRLPSEAEWEYACRAGSITDYSFGDDSSVLCEYAWYASNAEGRPEMVGTRKPNPWGLHDMHGNVKEWVEDDWHENYVGAPTDGRPWIDEPRGETRVVRGGCWVLSGYNCRSGYREGDFPYFPCQTTGFRVAMSVDLGS